MSGILILLGTNLNDRPNNLYRSICLLDEKKVKTLTKSSIHETEPWGVTDQPKFLNQVIEVDTELSPVDLLSTCLYVEQSMGRIRKRRWGERIIDIDILFYKDLVINRNDLIIPHQGILERDFTLKLLKEKWGDFIHPVLDKQITDL